MSSATARFNPTISDDVVTLQRRLVDDSNERYSAKQSLNNFSRKVDFYRQQLCALAASSSAATTQSKIQQAKELLQSFETEVRSGNEAKAHSVRFRSDAIGEARQSNEVLRQSLEETHRRCESLNADMRQQAEANEELVEKLGQVKDANKRLLEQIRFQTEEINQLTAQRLADEEKMDHMTRMHQQDREMFRQEAQRQIETLRQTAAEQYTAEKRRLTDKLHYVKTRANHVLQSASSLIEERKRLRADVDFMAEVVKVQLRRVEVDAAAKCNAHISGHIALCRATGDAIAELEAQNRSEQELRQSESLSWGHRYGSLSADKEDVQARMSRDMCQLSSQLQAMERTQEVERKAWSDERENLNKRIDDARLQKLARKEQHDQLQQKVVDLESSIQASEELLDSKRQSVKELRKQIRESDDALAAAVSGNEHLRAQMEEQRLRFQDKNEADLSECRMSYEKKAENDRVARDMETNASAKQLQLMEEELDQMQEAAQTCANQLDAVVSETDALCRDVTSWRGQHDGANASREGLEKEFGDSQQQFVMERLRLQRENEHLASYMANAEDEIRRTLEHLEEFQRVAVARETDHETRFASAHSSLRDAGQERDSLKRRLEDLADSHARAESEMIANKKRAADSMLVLEETVASKRKALKEQRERCEKEFDKHRQASELTLEEYEEERKSNATALQRLHVDSRTKLDVVSREKARTEETLRSEITSKREEVVQEQRRCDSFEHDLARLRCLLQESEANLAWVHQEFDREDRETSMSLRHASDDLQATRGMLAKAIQDEASLTRQIEETAQANDRDLKRMQQELDEVRQCMSMQRTEAETRLQREKSDLELDARSRRERAHGSVFLDRSQDETLERDSSQLHSMLADRSHLSGGGYEPVAVAPALPASSSHSPGLSVLHARLESHINRLQRHTEELRSSLRHSGDEPPLPTSSAFRPSHGPTGSPARVAASWTRDATWSGSMASPMPHKAAAGYSPFPRVGFASVSTDASLLGTSDVTIRGVPKPPASPTR